MTHNTIHNVGIAKQIGAYSDAIETKSDLRWLYTSGTPGLSEAGDLPKDISGQAELAWQHILKMLRQAHMAPTDLVKVTQYLTRAEDIPAYAKVRSRMLGDVRPAFMLLVVPHSFDQSFLLRLKQLRRAANLRLDLFEGARPRPDIPISSAPQYWDEGENPVFPWRVECVNNIDHLRMLLRISQRRPLSGRELRSRPAQRYVASMTLMVPSVRSSVEFALSQSLGYHGEMDDHMLSCAGPAGVRANRHRRF